MNEHEPEVKKSFWLVYTIVGLYYAAMIITYSFVVHDATEDGAQNVLPKQAE